jgi:type II secretory pathway predicted ATPase ExeA
MADNVSLDDDFDAPDEEERSVRTRRMSTYSVNAIKLAASVDKVYIVHPDCKTSLIGCDRAFQLCRELSQQQVIMIAGGTGVGKTALIKYFRASLPKSSLFEQGFGAIAVRLPSRPNVGQVIGTMLKQLKHPFPQVTNQTLAIKREVLIESLRQRGTRLLFIDESHNLRDQTRIRNRVHDGTTVTDCLRELVDEASVGLCLSGTDDLLHLDAVDSHLDNRVSARFQLRSFKDDGIWRGFLSTFRRHCTQIDLGIIDSVEHAQMLFAATGGNLRIFKRLVTEAVLVCADASATSVTQEHFKKAFDSISGDASRVGNPYA